MDKKHLYQPPVSNIVVLHLQNAILNGSAENFGDETVWINESFWEIEL